MSRKRSQERSQGEIVESAEEMHERLWSWRRGEPEASFEEIMERVRQEREALQKPMVEELVSEAGEVRVDVSCPACGAGLSNLSSNARTSAPGLARASSGTSPDDCQIQISPFPYAQHRRQSNHSPSPESHESQFRQSAQHSKHS